MKTVKIGMIGLGIVGSGVYELLQKNADLIASKSGIRLQLHRAVDLDSTRKKLLGISSSVFSTSPSSLIEDPGIDIVVQLIGGTTEAKKLMLQTLKRGKSVVTANKALLAEHGSEIFKAVLQNKVDLGYEGAVGGGIPIIKTIREALVGNVIHRIMGILNGTTNFILTKMTREGLDFDNALRIAQEMGFAEADPSLDVSGGDARHKIVILASLAFNTNIDISRVYVEGIENIEERDMEYANELGFVLKLLAIAERSEEGVLVKVHPTLLPKENPLAAISWEDNAVMVYSDFLGKSMYYGKGAGAHPTASGVVADIIDIARRIANKDEYNPSSYSFFQKLPQLPFERSRSRYYLRFQALDKPGILSKIAGILGENTISIASVIQKETEEKYEHVPLVMMTHEALEANIIKAVKKIDGLDEVEGRARIIRVINGDEFF